MNEEDTKKALLDYHESYRRFPSEESPQERATRVTAITDKRNQLFTASGPFDPRSFLKTLGFKEERLGGDRQYTLTHPTDPYAKLRVLVHFTNRMETFVDQANPSKKAIHELVPAFPSSPDAVYELIQRTQELVPMNFHVERLANAELNYLKNVNTNK